MVSKVCRSSAPFGRRKSRFIIRYLLKPFIDPEMTNIDDIISTNGHRLREAVSTFLVPLQTTRVLKRNAFDALAVEVKDLAKLRKGHELVPKALLNEIYGTMQVLRNEAPYFKGETATLEDMANQLEMTLGLILVGESHEDRVPGVPRIV
jgi:hypothetical protein